MKRIKHFKDKKANTYWQRWERTMKKERGTSNLRYRIFSGSKHSDWIIEGKLKKSKIIDKILEQECIKEN